MPQGAVIKINGQVEDLPVSEIEVTERIGEGTTFRLRLPVAIADDGDLPMLADSRIDPGAEVMILVQTAAGKHCLVKGLVHAHDIHLENGGDGSYVDVLGADKTIAMDRKNKVAVMPDGTASDAVHSVLSGYGLT